MQELYMNMENKKVQIDQKQIEKYNLKVGYISPFNSYKIVDKNGDDQLEPIKKRLPDEDEKAEGLVFTTSEIIDIANGADSY